MAIASKNRIGIVGAGALGCYYGAKLSRAGFDVHFLIRSDYEAVSANGLEIRSFQGDFTVRPAIHRSAHEMGPCDLVIVGIKTTDNAVLAELLPEVMGESTVVLTLQNGLGNEEFIGRIIEQTAAKRGWPIPAGGGMERVIGGTAFLCSNRIAPGVISHTSQGWIRMAEAQGPPRARTRAIAEMFRAAQVECEVYDSLLQARWEKLVWNIPFNGLGVAAESADTAVILADESLCGAARGLMEEVIAGAAGEGISIAPGFIDRMMELTAAMGAYKSSMQLDYEAGRPLEVEAILGEPLRRARKAGVATPRLEMLYGIVKRRNRAKL